MPHQIEKHRLIQANAQCVRLESAQMKLTEFRCTCVLTPCLSILIIVFGLGYWISLDPLLVARETPADLILTFRIGHGLMFVFAILLPITVYWNGKDSHQVNPRIIEWNADKRQLRWKDALWDRWYEAVLSEQSYVEVNEYDGCVLWVYDDPSKQRLLLSASLHEGSDVARSFLATLQARGIPGEIKKPVYLPVTW